MEASAIPRVLFFGILIAIKFEFVHTIAAVGTESCPVIATLLYEIIGDMHKLQSGQESITEKIDIFAGNIEVQQKRCPNGDWKRYGDSCYYFGQELLSWQDAACKSVGAHLADISSAMENDFITEGAKENGGLHWIDGTDAFSEGDWIWVTKMQRTGGLTFWNGGQPDNNFRGLSEEHCLETNHGPGGWNDRPCSYKSKFICEKEL